MPGIAGSPAGPNRSPRLPRNEPRMTIARNATILKSDRRPTVIGSRTTSHILHTSVPKTRMQRATPTPTPRPGDVDANRLEPAHCTRIGCVSRSRPDLIILQAVVPCEKCRFTSGGAIPKTHCRSPARHLILLIAIATTTTTMCRSKIHFLVKPQNYLNATSEYMDGLK